MRIWICLKGGLVLVFGYCGVMYKSNHFRFTILKDKIKGIDVAGRLTVQGAKSHSKEKKRQSVCWEAAGGPFLSISGSSFVKVKANSEISDFGKGIGGRHKVWGFQQKGEVRIDEGDGIAIEYACVGGHWYFAEFFELWCRIAATVFDTAGTHLKAQENGVKNKCRFGIDRPWQGMRFYISKGSCCDWESLVVSVCLLGHVGNEFLEHRERFGAIKG